MNFKKYLVKGGTLVTGLAMVLAMPMATLADAEVGSAVKVNLSVAAMEQTFDFSFDLNGADSSLMFTGEFAHPMALADSAAFAKKIFKMVGLGDRFALADVRTQDMGGMSAKFEEQTQLGGEVKLEVKLDQDGMVKIEFKQTGTEAEILARAMAIKTNAAMMHKTPMMMPAQM